jgi:hypothetical protein
MHIYMVCFISIRPVMSYMNRYSRNIASIKVRPSKFCRAYASPIPLWLPIFRFVVPILASLLEFDACALQRLREDPTVRNLDLSSYLLVPSMQLTFVVP